MQNLLRCGRILFQFVGDLGSRHFAFGVRRLEGRGGSERRGSWSGYQSGDEIRETADYPIASRNRRTVLEISRPRWTPADIERDQADGAIAL